MSLTHRYKLVPCKEVLVDREKRQRKLIEVGDLKESIRKRGVINPIIITRGLELVAGERRLTACLELGLPSIPCRFAEDLSWRELQIIELEENLKRSDLPWRDATTSIQRIHDLYCLDSEDWSQSKTAEELGLSPNAISMYLRVASQLDSPRIAMATGLASAYNVLSRMDERALGNAVADIIEAGTTLLAEKAPTHVSTPNQPDPPKPPLVIPSEDSILAQSFLDWAPSYSGPKFNFLHCDFPYGINVFSGPMSGKNSATTYKDSPDVYWTLIRCLGENLDRILAPSAHIMFWFSMEHYHETFEAFRKFAPSIDLQKFPLMWHKSDNVGILPDPKRGPRRVYETALIGSREDRPILKAVSNVYPAPTDKAHHPSTKPEPMLRHFFTMFVDEHSRVLDPTCGGGSALRAAESMGAKATLGLEVDPEHCTNARSALRQFRVLRSVSK